jgi:RHS repeat-associated protein
MSALAQTTHRDYYTRAANEDYINGGPRTRTKYSYDSRNNITSITVVAKNGGGSLMSSATYPASCANPKTCNKPLTVTDQSGVTTTYTYDSTHGGVLTETQTAVNGVQAQTRYTYAQQTPYIKNSAGSLVASSPVWRLTSISKCMSMSLAACVGTVDEVRTDIVYSGNNVLPTSNTVKRGDGSLAQTTTTAYDIYGNVTSVTGPRGGSDDTTYYFYDALRRVIGMIGPDPDSSGPRLRQGTSTTYNSDGQVTSVKRGAVNGTTLAALNAMSVLTQHATSYSTATGLPIVERDFDGAGALLAVVQKSYDSNFRVDCVTQRLNPTLYYSDAALPAACTLGTAGADGNDRITRYTYDATNAVIKTTSGYGTASQRDNKVNTYDPVNGLLTAEADALGNKTVYTYDNFKRPYQTLYPTPANGTVSSSTDYTQTNYSGALVSSLRLRDGQLINYTYDALARISSKSGAVSESFGYNNFNQVIGHTNNSTNASTSLTSNYVFNSLGWLLSETRLAGATSLGAVSYGYDAYGRRSQLTWPDGFSISYNYLVGSYPGDYLQTINESGGTQLASLVYDDIGRRTQVTRGTGVAGNSVQTGYGYDALSRLTSLATDVGGSVNSNDDIGESFSYTAASQVSSRQLTVTNNNYVYTPTINATNYTVNGLNQIATTNGTALGYDGRGNLTTDNSGGTYVYNANNLLTSATQGGSTTTLSYDAENRLYGISKNGTTTKFVYDGVNLIAETDASNTVLRRYVHGPGTDEPLVWYEGSGTTDKRYLTPDRQGSLVGITNTAGTTLNINAYDEYGIPKATNLGRYQYTGQTWLSEIGLYYYRARLYNPTLGRFMQTDPIGYKDGMNWYAYVGDDPIGNSDTTGTACVVANGWSDFCRRAYEYAGFDRVLGAKTRFFGAASLTTQYLADMESPIVGRYVSDPTRQFMRQLSSELEKMNQGTALAIEHGSLSHSNLDAVMVHKEQTAVQERLDALSNKDPKAYASMIKEVNGLLNPTGAMNSASEVYGTFTTNGVYLGILNGVRNSLGRDIDFSSQSDREAIGKAAIDYLNSLPGCRPLRDAIGTSCKF